MKVHLQKYPPSPALAGVVDCYLTCKTEGSPDQVSEVHSCPPLDLAVWLIHIDGHRSRSHSSGQFFPQAYLVGIMKEPVLWTLQGNSSLFGVHLKPEAAIRIFQLPLSKTFNSYLDTDSILGKNTAHITAQIREAADDLSRIALVEAFILERLRHIHWQETYFTRALALMRNNIGEMNMARICEESFICDRQLQRSFKSNLGISPKSFLRIVRFRQACQMARNKKYSFSDIAYTLGYSDPAHFNREFKAFAGDTPARFFQEHRD